MPQKHQRPAAPLAVSLSVPLSGSLIGQGAGQGAGQGGGRATSAGMLNVTQHWFDHDMDQWGKTHGAEVHESGHRQSRLLGPDGTPMVYPKPRLGFDLTPRQRSGA